MTMPATHAAPVDHEVASITQVVADLRTAYDTGRTRPLAWRLNQLAALAALVEENEQEICAALFADLGKTPDEANITELSLVRAELALMRSKLKKWLEPKFVRGPLAVLPATTYTVLEPLGVALIIAPWNYPVQLLLVPAIGALAAGNAVRLKPSELAPATAALLADLIPRYLDPAAVTVVNGGIPQTTALLTEKFDHIFYTGNGTVARIVMTAAAAHLTPVTLELGGKSPTFVDGTGDLEIAAQRIAWGKFTNAGQTCVAPDYVLATPGVADRLVPLIAQAVADMFGADPKAGPFGRIINEGHFNRLAALVADPENGRVALGGQHDRSVKYLAPTILTGTAPDAPIMSAEIFGPVLPVVTVESAGAAIAHINAGDKPLALYVFSEDKAVRRRFLKETSSGAITFNLPMAHLAVAELPFGGVGESGMGAYHGRRSLEIFSHEKSVVSKPLRPDTLALVYPPFSRQKSGLLRKLLG